MSVPEAEIDVNEKTEKLVRFSSIPVKTPELDMRRTRLKGPNVRHIAQLMNKLD